MGFLNCYDISMLTYGKIPLIGPIFEYSPINYSDLLLARGAYAWKPNCRPTVQI